MKRKVLFLCETNGLRSLMAEALLSRIDSEHFEAVGVSRGCRRLHPFAVEVMREIGVDLSGRALKHMEDLKDDKFDNVIILGEGCKHAYENFQRGNTICWNVDDPVAASDDPEKQLRAFRIVRDQIAQRLRLFVIVHVRPQTRSTAA